MIRAMSEADLRGVIQVHMQSFKGFFLTFLGHKFLTIYYRGVVNYNDAIKFVYLENNNVKGFIVGTLNPSVFYKNLLRNDWLRFCIESIPSLLKSPKIVFRLIRALRKPDMQPKEPNAVELSSLAILPESQGKGIGQVLLNAFINEVKQRGGKYIYLTTDVNNNEKVNAFYQNMGFKVRKVLKTPENRLMNEYSYEIEN